MEKVQIGDRVKRKRQKGVVVDVYPHTFRVQWENGWKECFQNPLQNEPEIQVKRKG